MAGAARTRGLAAYCLVGSFALYAMADFIPPPLFPSTNSTNTESNEEDVGIIIIHGEFSGLAVNAGIVSYYIRVCVDPDHDTAKAASPPPPHHNHNSGDWVRLKHLSDSSSSFDSFP